MQTDRTAHTTIQDDIDDAYKSAFKGRDERVFRPLRHILSVIKQACIDQRKDLSNEEILAILKTEVKKRREVLVQFKQANRADLVAQTENELDQIQKFMPAEMTDGELQTMVQETIGEMGEVGKQDLGKVMGAVMKKVQGKADGSRVKALVEKSLS